MAIEDLSPEIQAKLRNFMPRLESFVNSLIPGSCVPEAFNQAGISLAEGELKNGMTVKELKELCKRYGWQYLDPPMVISPQSSAIIIYRVRPGEGHAEYKGPNVSMEKFTGKEFLGCILLKN